MDRSPESLDELLDRIVAWAERNPDIRAAFLVGSRARTDVPADEWSDLDVPLIAVNPEQYLATTEWLSALGEPWLTFLEGMIVGGQERRVLFAGGLDVDFALFSPARFREIVRDVPHTAVVLRRGCRVLVDKDDLAAVLTGLPAGPPAPRLPEPPEFENAVQDFWYHAVWAAKKLRRGELFIAKGCVDGHMKRLLREVIECHARATHGPHYDTWHDGRFLDRWADPRAVAALRDAYAHYDEADVRRALEATMALFHWLAVETAERLGYPYPANADARATALVRQYLIT
jgi:aminoglycoside 6-adenylyltransferase